MIEPAIKVGPKDWRKRLEKSQAKFVEVWYRVDKPEWYKAMFDFLNENSIATGLHFWGVTRDGYEPNIAYPGGLDETISLIEGCIDVANKQGFKYVNIHAGNRQRFSLNLDSSIIFPDENGKIIPLKKALEIQKNSLLHLSNYTQNGGLNLLVEPVIANIPKGNFSNPHSRLETYSYHHIPASNLVPLARKDKILITNDLSHILADRNHGTRSELWDHLYHLSLELAPFTQVVHINTLTPPYNGTDSHNGILERDWSLPGIIPNKTELITLLSLFERQPQTVWAVGEPRDHHIENFQTLSKLLNSL